MSSDRQAFFASYSSKFNPKDSHQYQKRNYPTRALFSFSFAFGDNHHIANLCDMAKRQKPQKWDITKRQCTQDGYVPIRLQVAFAPAAAQSYPQNSARPTTSFASIWTPRSSCCLEAQIILMQCYLDTPKSLPANHSVWLQISLRLQYLERLPQKLRWQLPGQT